MCFSDYLDAGKCNWTVSISPKASVRFDQALWGVCCTCKPTAHSWGRDDRRSGQNMPAETDETTYFCFLRKLCFSYGSRIFNVVVQIGNFPSTSSCRLEGEQCQLAHAFSQPFPHSLSLCIAMLGISLWLSVKAIPIQGFQFLSKNPGTYLIQHPRV